jgi:hypothetical protein
MMRGIVFLFFILWKIEGQPTYVPYSPPPEPNSSFPSTSAVQPRFCSLDTNATSYDCEWAAYTNNLTLRALGSIIGASVIFLIFMVFVCTCCWSTSLQDRLKVTKKEGIGADCYPALKVVIMGIPFFYFNCWSSIFGCCV